MRFFTAFCTFSNESASIWRTRSRETPNSSASFRERDRVLGEPTRFEDASLAIVEHGERRGKRLAAVVELVARGKGSLLARSLVSQPVQPFAGIAVRANRRVERGVAAEPPVHVDHVLLRDAEPLGDGFLVMADI